MIRSLTILISFVYLTMTSGVVVSLHYCMGELSEIAWGKQGGDKCSRCGMDNTGCCHDDVKVVKLQDDQQSVSMGIQIPSAVSFAQIPSNHSPSRVFDARAANPLYSIHAPPLDQGISPNILNCVFRI